jgi:hypothetical protein
MNVGAASSGSIRVGAARWVRGRRLDRKNTRPRGGGIPLGAAVEELVQLEQLELDGGDGGVDL